MRVNSRLAIVLLIAALCLTRLPFLLKSDAFFEADEAVEGLMALHVWNGEFPAFMWSQGYKGVPEIYLTAPLLKLTGPEPWALKAVTLAIFALFTFALFRLAERIHSRAAAIAACSIVVLGPASLVYWSLAGTAEVVFTLLLGTVLLIVVSVPRPSTRHYAIGGVVAGAMLWVHAYAAYYFLPLGVWWLARTRRDAGNTHDRLSTVVAIALAVAAAAYTALWINALAGGSGRLTFGPIDFSARNPRKLIRVAVALAALAAIVWRTGVPRWPAARPAAAAAAGFVVGFAPAILHGAAHGLGWPGRQANVNALAAFLGEAIGIFAGADAPDTWSSGIPGIFYAPALLLIIWFVARGTPTRSAEAHRVVTILRLMLACAPILFLLGAAGGDAQSYRYLMPLYGAIPIAIAVSVMDLSERSRAFAAVLLAGILLMGAISQVRWYRRLEATPERRALIATLERAGVNGGYAEYWEAYPLTFLSGERVIVVPTSGVRYPPHAEAVGRMRTTVGIARVDGKLTVIDR